MCSTLSGVVEYMTSADSDCVLRLGLIEVGEGVKISLSTLMNCFPLSGDYKGGRGRPLCGGHHLELPFFFDVAPKQSDC